MWILVSVCVRVRRRYTGRERARVKGGVRVSQSQSHSIFKRHYISSSVYVSASVCQGQSRRLSVCDIVRVRDNMNQCQHIRQCLSVSVFVSANCFRVQFTSPKSMCIGVSVCNSAFQLVSDSVIWSYIQIIVSVYVFRTCMNSSAKPNFWSRTSRASCYQLAECMYLCGAMRYEVLFVKVFSA